MIFFNMAVLFFKESNFSNKKTENNKILKLIIYGWQVTDSYSFTVNEPHQCPQLLKEFHIFVCCTFYELYDGDIFHFVF